MCEDLAHDMALAVDSVAILGGGSNQPTRIVATPGVRSYVAIADAGNGSALVWGDIVAMSELLEEANVDQLGGGYLVIEPLGVRLYSCKLFRSGRHEWIEFPSCEYESKAEEIRSNSRRHAARGVRGISIRNA